VLLRTGAEHGATGPTNGILVQGTISSSDGEKVRLRENTFQIWSGICSTEMLIYGYYYD
jgi:hypothetical protein